MTFPRKKITAPAVRAMKKGPSPLVVLTAADFITARLLDEAGVDIILVGDSLGTTLLGYESTVRVTMEEMLHHVKAVTRARPSALVVADMPFGSYQPSVRTAVNNAVRMVQEGRADAVKMEGGVDLASRIAAVVAAGVPVMGHIGLLPQSVLREGGYRVQGRGEEAAGKLEKDLQAVERAGAFACVLEYVTAPLAESLTKAAAIPTIGIGSGLGCDGQVLVTSDLLGLQSWLTPKAARHYLEGGKMFKEAFERFADDVRHKRFPGKKESF